MSIPEKIYLSLWHVEHLVDTHHIDTPNEDGSHIEYTRTSTWQPIESCPQNRSLVMLYNEDTNDYALRISHHGEYYTTDGRSTNNIHNKPEVFTHFMYLPPLPHKQ